MAVVAEHEIAHLRGYAKTSLLHHIWAVHNFDPPAHQKNIWIPALEDMSIKRLILVAPPKYGKTIMVGLDYLGWRIGNNPNYHGIYVSNTATQAYKPSVALRDTISGNSMYRWFYDVYPNPVKGWAEHEWFVERPNEGDKDPTLQACGVGGPLLGATVEEVILDDIADPENMATIYQRDKLMSWVRNVAFSRLIPGGRVVHICTRWNEDDPAARFGKEGWKVFSISAIDCEDAWYHDDVAQRWKLTPAGRAGLTYPEYWTPEAIEERRLDLGTKDFMLMFQNQTLPEGGNIFKHEWWQYYDHLPAASMIIQSLDTGFKTGHENDYSAMETWAACDDGYYLIDAWHGKVAFPELKAMLMRSYEQHHPVAILVEDAASGQSLIQEARSKTSLPIIPVKPDRDKISRAIAITPILEAGRVKLPRQAYWLQEWLYEHEVFPNGAHDDFVDCSGYALNWLRTHEPTGMAQPREVTKHSLWRDY